MKLSPLAAAFLLLPLTLTAAPLPPSPEKLGDIRLNDGRTLLKVSLLRAEPDGLRLEHAAGVGKVAFEDLPKSLQSRFQFDPAKASAFRSAALEEDARRAAEETRRLASEVMQKEASRQESDVQRAREAFYQLLSDGGYNFAQVDKALRDSIAILKEANRPDLAELLEKDRATLAARETVRGTEESKREREKLLARIRDLEAQVAALQNRPLDVAVVQQTDFIPFFVDRPVIVPVPTPIPDPCPPPTRPIRPIQPSPVPITNLPISNLTNGIPYVLPATGNRPVTQPIRVPQPNVPPASGSRPVTQPIRVPQPDVPPASGNRPVTQPISIPQPNVRPASGISPLPTPSFTPPASNFSPPPGMAPVTGSHLWQGQRP